MVKYFYSNRVDDEWKNLSDEKKIMKRTLMIESVVWQKTGASVKIISIHEWVITEKHKYNHINKIKTQTYKKKKKTDFDGKEVVISKFLVTGENLKKKNMIKVMIRSI